jgi:hypothetical protein
MQKAELGQETPVGAWPAVSNWPLPVHLDPFQVNALPFVSTAEQNDDDGHDTYANGTEPSRLVGPAQPLAADAGEAIAIKLAAAASASSLTQALSIGGPPRAIGSRKREHGPQKREHRRPLAAP